MVYYYTIITTPLVNSSIDQILLFYRVHYLIQSTNKYFIKLLAVLKVSYTGTKEAGQNLPAPY